MLRDDLGSSRSTLCLRFGSAGRGGGDTYIRAKGYSPRFAALRSFDPSAFRAYKNGSFWTCERRGESTERPRCTHRPFW